MEKERFLFLLSNQSSLTSEETEEIATVQAEFPYSQVIHNLVARGCQLNELSDRQAKLNVAAVYATDRSVLKSFITAPAQIRSVQKSVTADKDVEKGRPPKEITAKPKAVTTLPPKQTTSTQPAPSHIAVNLSGDDLIEEVFHDIEKLKKLKHDFELVADGFELPEKAEVKTPEPKSSVSGSKKENVPANEPDGIIAEIKSTKKKIKPSDPRQKEQLEIIDQFIKSKPVMPKGTPPPKKQEPATDLSESSGVFTENIVSETLVEILIKQGKKEKAVEVLKKLIWKFPQKKAYFAAQIEELTR